MRTISKSIEPQLLTKHRLTAHASFANLPPDAKQTLRNALVSEQRGLCCYCLCRIEADVHSMKIEHWKAQSKYPDEQLVYANLLAACLGNEGQPPEDQTCDTKKADNDLSRNPAYPIPSIEDMVWYIDGRIGSNNAAFHQELETVLNLNAQHLISNRKSVVNSLQTRLKLILNLKPKAQRNQLQRLYDRYSANAQNGHLEPYCTVITYLVGKLLVTAPPVPNQSGT